MRNWLKNLSSEEAVICGMIVSLCVLWTVVLIGAIVQGRKNADADAPAKAKRPPVMYPIQTGNGTQVWIPI